MSDFVKKLTDKLNESDYYEFTEEMVKTALKKTFLSEEDPVEVSLRTSELSELAYTRGFMEHARSIEPTINKLKERIKILENIVEAVADANVRLVDITDAREYFEKYK